MATSAANTTPVLPPHTPWATPLSVRSSRWTSRARGLLRSRQSVARQPRNLAVDSRLASARNATRRHGAAPPFALLMGEASGVSKRDAPKGQWAAYLTARRTAGASAASKKGATDQQKEAQSFA
eukprot:2109912-Pyramimonas_sp.AAC.1